MVDVVGKLNKPFQQIKTIPIIVQDKFLKFFSINSPRH
jgi:hypothetical protein